MSEAPCSVTYAKKKCLIGLYGLSRTFKQTSPLLFERLIEPNKHKYEFDIIINTDSNNHCCTWGRPDARSGISIHKYDTIDHFKLDLYDSYNKYNQLKDIIIYNYDNSIPIFSWCIVYKRIQSILLKAFENNAVYDMYIMMRIDVAMDNILHLDNINNELLLITGIYTREGFFHNRDQDFLICGNYQPFMYGVISRIKLLDSLVSKQTETEHFFSKDNFVGQDVIDLFNERMDFILNKKKSANNNEIIDKIKLKHTPCGLEDKYYKNNSVVSIDYSKAYDISYEEFFERMLDCIRIVLSSNSTFILSENKQSPIHCYIVR